MTEGGKETAICAGCFDEFDLEAGDAGAKLCPRCAVRAAAAAPDAVDPFDDLLSAEAWREGKLLVTSRFDPKLPEGCVKCGGPEDGGRLPRSLHWHHPLVYLALLGGPVLYIIVAAVTRRQAQVAAPLCRRHRADHRRWVRLSWACCILGLAAIPVGALLRVPAVAVGGIGLFLLAIVPAAIADAKPFRAVRMDPEYVWVKGAGPAWLDRLPEGPPDFSDL